MKTHDLIQGSAEWHAHRATHFNASDAPAMMGCSPYETRTQLLHRMHTGLTPEVDAATQRRFDDGHRFESLARPLAEEIIGEAIYPVTGSIDEYSASFDGLTMAEDVAFEHKSLNGDLREVMEGEDESDRLPMQYRIQMEQQLMICEGKKCLFMASKWEGNTLIEKRYCWYYSNAALRQQIITGWHQFKKDLEAYTPPAAAPNVVAEPVQALPAVLVQVTGEITVKDNFKAFETALRDFLENRLIREPKTDQDFADLDLQIKAMKGAEEALEGAESQMLAQVQSIDQAKKTRDMLGKLVRDNRLMAEKLLASEKDRRRGEIVAGGVAEFAKHIKALNERINRTSWRHSVSMPSILADFGGVIKGMKSMASMENAVATELARAKIEANAVADRIHVNLNTLRDLAKDHAFLFSDTPTIVLKAQDDLAALVKLRIADHKSAEEMKEAETRERIRGEEEERANKEAMAKLEAFRREESAKSAAAQPAPPAPPAPAVQAVQPATVTVRQVVQPLFPESTPRQAPSTPPTLKLGQISERLGFNLTGDFLAGLGFPPVSTDKNAKLYRLCDYPAICAALKRHIDSTIDEPCPF